MSRFADPAKTGIYTLPGACQCPGTPHQVVPGPDGKPIGPDWIKFRLEAGGADMTSMIYGGSNVAVVRTLAVEWNLLGDDGKPAPLTPDNIGRLFSDNWQLLDDWIEANVKQTALPKDSGDQSSSGTSESDRPNRAARRKGRSTKS